MTEKMEDKSVDEVAQAMANCEPGSNQDQRAKAEFYRRQTMAIESTSKHTKKYTLYMLLSVVVIAFSFLATLVFDYLNYSKEEKYIFYTKPGYILRLNKETGHLCQITNGPRNIAQQYDEYEKLEHCEFNQ